MGKGLRGIAGSKKTPMDEAREGIIVQVLAHVPVRTFSQEQNVLKLTCSFK
jgi:hypothetical protein